MGELIPLSCAARANPGWPPGDQVQTSVQMGAVLIHVMVAGPSEQLGLTSSGVPGGDPQAKHAFGSVGLWENVRGSLEL